MSDQKSPLWEVIEQTIKDSPVTGGPLYAAQIRAIADWLIPDDPVPDIVLEGSLDAFGIYMAFHRQRMALRRQLLDEADSAERGDSPMPCNSPQYSPPRLTTIRHDY